MYRNASAYHSFVVFELFRNQNRPHQENWIEKKGAGVLGPTKAELGFTCATWSCWGQLPTPFKAKKTNCRIEFAKLARIGPSLGSGCPSKGPKLRYLGANWSPSWSQWARRTHTGRQTGRQAGRRQTDSQTATHAHTHTVCVHIHTYIRTYVRTYIYIYYIYIYVYGTGLQPPPPIHFLICMYIHLSIVVRMHACTCANGHNTFCTRPYPDRHAHIEYPHRMYIVRQMYPNILCPQIYVHLTYVPVYMYIHTPKCQPLSTSYEWVPGSHCSCAIYACCAVQCMECATNDSSANENFGSIHSVFRVVFSQSTVLGIWRWKEHNGKTWHQWSGTLSFSSLPSYGSNVVISTRHTHTHTHPRRKSIYAFCNMDLVALTCKYCFDDM